jgi:hypothetical protein
MLMCKQVDYCPNCEVLAARNALLQDRIAELEEDKRELEALLRVERTDRVSIAGKAYEKC